MLQQQVDQTIGALLVLQDLRFGADQSAVVPFPILREVEMLVEGKLDLSSVHGLQWAPLSERALELLEEEIKICLGLLGVTSYSQLDRSFVREAQSVADPDALSAFPLL